ncbi:condensation domain-containing protein, partial [Xenorhabdus szentirmaii]|uniref:condensation domain-containing protein n=1 Tax=Xenorhabdus szentirmaii TaxID=290112 RepID=UPI00198765D4
RHEILRTTLQLVDGHAEQIIAPADQGFNLTTQDLRPLTAAEKQAAMEDAIRHEYSHPFDFAAEPLIRGQLLKLAGDEHVILLTQHHMVS